MLIRFYYLVSFRFRMKSAIVWVCFIIILWAYLNCNNNEMLNFSLDFKKVVGKLWKFLKQLWYKKEQLWVTTDSVLLATNGPLWVFILTNIKGNKERVGILLYIGTNYEWWIFFVSFHKTVTFKEIIIICNKLLWTLQNYKFWILLYFPIIFFKFNF